MEYQVNTFNYDRNEKNNFKSVDLYYSSHSNSNSPLVVFIHGGAWRTEDKADYKQLCEDFVKAGITVASANYRLSLKENDQAIASVQHPDHMNDVGECVKFLYSSAPIENKYNPEKIYLVGHSAGAHTAALLLLDSPYHVYIQGILGVSGIYDIPLLIETFPSYRGFIEQAFGSKVSYQDDSPAYKKSYQLANKPIIIAQSPDDTLIDNPQAKVMFDHLKSFHSNVILDFDIKGDHYLIMNFNNLYRLVEDLIK